MPINNIKTETENGLKFCKKDAVISAVTGVLLFFAFVLWTILIQHVDVQAAGPNGSRIGFASFNIWFHQVTGVNMMLYTITDWLGLVPILICLFFGMIGFLQLIRRRSLRKVDMDIILLGVYYILVIFGYLFFEIVRINYRPLLIEGRLEASYPSSTTLLVLTVMPAMKFQVDRRVQNRVVRIMVNLFVIGFSAFMVISRTISGVHWVTDIIASVFLSAGLYLLYRAAVIMSERK